MKNIIYAIVVFSINILPQHLPLQIGNQWHYKLGLGAIDPNVAIATDTTKINDQTYFKIEIRQPISDSLMWTTYDRIEGDSLYFRFRQGKDELLFNFNWQDDQIVSFTYPYDTTCNEVMVIDKKPVTVWGIDTYYYHPNDGYVCPKESPDTAWSLSNFTYLQYFGCLDCDDGYLMGAVINGTTYGTLHPLPVELLTFRAEVCEKNVELTWETASEINNRGFELYKKSSGQDSKYHLIEFISGLGTTTEKQTYSFTDENVLDNKVYYKLIQYDFDGSSKIIGEIEVTLESVPTSPSLYQNYPNPFNPVTTIKYQIPEQGLVTIKIYNSLGEGIETLVNEFQSEGLHSVDFEASGLTSGIYFYQLKTANNILARKMILLQ